MVAIVVALLTGRERWLEVAYFWGIGGTLQAIITPDLRHAFPDVRFLQLFHRRIPASWSGLSF